MDGKKRAAIKIPNPTDKVTELAMLKYEATASIFWLLYYVIKQQKKRHCKNAQTNYTVPTSHYVCPIANIQTTFRHAFTLQST